MIAELLIIILIAVFAMLTGYSLCNKERLKTEERCLELAKKCKALESNTKYRDILINNQSEKLIIKNGYLKEIIRVTENNTYANNDVIIRKIRELAETAIKTSSKQ